VSTATCDIRFSLQNRYAKHSLVTALGNLGVSNRAVTLSGRATRSEKEISKEEFLGADAEAIRTALTRFLERNDLPRANDLVILDMEPRDIAPRHLASSRGSSSGNSSLRTGDVSAWPDRCCGGPSRLPTRHWIAALAGVHLSEYSDCQSRFNDVV
jgi:hypothetical protein